MQKINFVNFWSRAYSFGLSVKWTMAGEHVPQTEKKLKGQAEGDMIMNLKKILGMNLLNY